MTLLDQDPVLLLALAELLRPLPDQLLQLVAVAVQLLLCVFPLGYVSYGGLKEGFPLFLDLFRSNRQDKAAFMTEQKASFFQALAEAAAEENMLRLCLLYFEGRPVSAAMCFDYGSSAFLYNSGYNARFSELNVGLLCKVLSIRDSIERGRRSYDFLKGDEIYKQRLGGRPVRLYRCTVALSE